MSLAEISDRAPALLPWPFAVVGLVALTIGLCFVIRPRKTGERWRKIQQAVQPYWTVPKMPVGVNIAVGCLFLLIAIVMAFFAWALLQK